MKRILIFILCLSSLVSLAQSWTPSQLNAANTAKDIDYLTDIEKSAIEYINLARLYPELFIRNELDDYAGHSRNKKTLIKELKKREPVNALQFDKPMYDLAGCFAKEIGNAGLVTHKRTLCPYGYLAECCSFGMTTGKDIAMQWLIDDGIKDLGHRRNCLNKEYTMIGIAAHSHKAYSTCAVADFK